MKLLPCSSRSCASLGALFPPSRAYPNGEPGVSGQYVSRYKCFRCKQPTDLTHVQWNRLQAMTLEDFVRAAISLKAPALAELPTRDFTANGLTKAQAEDTFRAGFLDTREAEEAQGMPPVLVEQGAWHTPESEVYHDRKDCQTGDNISTRYLQAGKGGKRRCQECARLSGERRK
jgi:hypothetical protein